METDKEFIKRKSDEFKKNKIVSCRAITFYREAYTFMPQSNCEDKVFIVERLRGEKNNEIEYRFGYYIVGRNGRARNKWVWGQFCPMIPQKDFKKLITKAEKEETIL